MLKWTRERFNLVDFINILFSEVESISGEAYTALMNHIRAVDPDLASELSKNVVLIDEDTDARVQLAATLKLDAGENEPEYVLPPTEAAKLNPGVQAILGEMQGLFFDDGEGNIVTDQPVSGSECVDLATRLLAAMGLWPVPADEYQPGQ